MALKPAEILDCQKPTNDYMPIYLSRTWNKKRLLQAKGPHGHLIANVRVLQMIHPTCCQGMAFQYSEKWKAHLKESC
jgi:hypothetical protein